MGKRSKGRALLLQAMYASRQSGRSLAECLADQIERREPAPETDTFARELARKVSSHGRDLEAALGPLLVNWDLDRVGLLERQILTIALVELHHSPEVPAAVIIDEACELARIFCDEDAVRFVNGVLDRARRDLDAGGGA